MLTTVTITRTITVTSNKEAKDEQTNKQTHPDSEDIEPQDCSSPTAAAAEKSNELERNKNEERNMK